MSAMNGKHKGGANTAHRAASPFIECGAEDPCPVCLRYEGCRVSDRQIACVWHTRHNLAQTRQSPTGTTYGLYDRRTFRAVPPIEDAIELLSRYFFSRTDLVAFVPPWDQAACPAVGEDTVPFLLRAHLGGEKVRCPWKTARKEGLTRQSGNWRIGSYGPAPDGTARWTVCDFDGGSDHADPLADPLAVAFTSYRRFWSAGVPCYLERSRSCSGWHLWTFFREPIAARKARSLAFTLLPDNILNLNGENAEVEVFPRRDDLINRRVGNQVWLPWYSNAKRGGNVFYRPWDRGLRPFIPEDFATISEDKVDKILAKQGACA